MINIVERARNIFSSSFSFKKKFNYDLYNSLDTNDQYCYLIENKNALSNHEFQSECLVVLEKREKERKEKLKLKFNPSDFPPALQPHHHPVGPKPFSFQIGGQKERDYIQRNYTHGIDPILYTYSKNGQSVQTLMDSMIRNIEIGEKEKLKKIDEMNEGCILLITENETLITPLIANVAPDQFRYRMIINHLSKYNDYKYSTFHDLITELFPFIEDELIKIDSSIENYFPLDLRQAFNGRSFYCKWLFIKNTSQVTIMVYLKDGKSYNSREFVSIKPGGIITLLFGNMLNCSQYKIEAGRVPNDHPFVIQYKDKTHPIIKDNEIKVDEIEKDKTKL